MTLIKPGPSWTFLLPFTIIGCQVNIHGFKLEDDLRKNFDFFQDNAYDIRKLSQLNNLWRRKFGLPQILFEVGNPTALERGKPADVDERCELSKSTDSALKFEGDIILTPKQLNGFLRAARPRRRLKRKIIRDPASHWTSTTIHYTVDDALDERRKNAIEGAIKHWEQETCVRFRKGKSENYLHFFPGNGCYSSVGVIGKRQGVSIGIGCDTVGIVAHEIGHALGFWHEQSRPDRDSFITINYDNLMPQVEGNFQKSTWGATTNGSELYDLGSIMHYGPTAFTDNGDNTIDTNDPAYRNTIGQRKSLSFIDVKQANGIYCKDTCRNSKVKCYHEGYKDPNKCNQCKCPTGFGGRTCNQPAKSDKSCNSRSLWGAKSKKTLSSGRITKPNMYCSWLIKCKRGKAVVLLQKASFYCRSTCYDFVEIKRRQFPKTGARFCCNPPAEPLRSEGPVLSVSVQTTEDATTGFDGFQLSYWCEGNEPGIDVSPNQKAKPKQKNGGAKRNGGKTNPPSRKKGRRLKMWGSWSTWSPCSATCGLCGNQRRYRQCLSDGCKANSFEIRECTRNICPGSAYPTPGASGSGEGRRKVRFCTKVIDAPCDMVPELFDKYRNVYILDHLSSSAEPPDNSGDSREHSGAWRGYDDDSEEETAYRRRWRTSVNKRRTKQRNNPRKHRSRSGQRRNSRNWQRQPPIGRSFGGTWTSWSGSVRRIDVCRMRVRGRCRGFLGLVPDGATFLEAKKAWLTFLMRRQRKRSRNEGIRRGRNRRGRYRDQSKTNKNCCSGTRKGTVCVL